MPFSGPSLESLSVPERQFATFPSGSINLGAITRRQLQDLARGVNELAKIGVAHGDINERNVLLKPCCDLAATYTAEGYLEKSRLVLVDFGEVAPDYQGDVYALGELFGWCAEGCAWGGEDHVKVREAARILKEDRDFERALAALEWEV